MGGTESVTSAWSVLEFKARQATCFKCEAHKTIIEKSVSISDNVVRVIHYVCCRNVMTHEVIANILHSLTFLVLTFFLNSRLLPVFIFLSVFVNYVYTFCTIVIFF